MDDVLLKTITRYFLGPPILLYGLYVIAHGEVGPGGGFQGGVIIAAGFALYSLVFGIKESKKLLPSFVRDKLPALSLLGFITLGLITMALGGEFLQFNRLPFSDERLAAEMGILAVEIAIGVGVSSLILGIFFELTDIGGEDEYKKKAS